MITTLFMVIIVAMVLTRLLGVNSCSHERRLRWGDRDGRLAEGQEERVRLRRHESRATAHRRAERTAEPSSASQLRTASTRVETPLERLQREFAQGHITVDQYEHEVGKLYGVRGEA